MERLDPKTTAVVVVDIQERLAPAMPEASLAQTVRSARILCEGSRLLGAPLFVTEQYPKGLGPTIATVAEAALAASPHKFEKTEFSAADVAAFRDALKSAAVTDVVVVGMESHVCVFQTVRDLVNTGLSVYVPIDGVCSRRDDHREAGLALCEEAGATRTTTESVVFDWLRKAGGGEFRALSKLIR